MSTSLFSRFIMQASAAMLMMLSGCASFPAADNTKSFNVGGLELLSKTAEKEIIVFRSPDDKERYCMAPPPDAVPTAGGGISLGAVSGQGIGESVNIGADTLGGRSPATLITRELMYRSCELSLNYQLDKDEAVALYRETLDAVLKVTNSQTAAGTSAVESSNTTVAVPTPTKSSTGSSSSTSTPQIDESDNF